MICSFSCKVSRSVGFEQNQLIVLESYTPREVKKAMGLGLLNDGLAQTPPMGWNSWNRFKRDIDERLIVDTARAMVENGMRDVGYQYVVIDDCWEAPERDSKGNLCANPFTFPSGIKALADYVHSLGLKFGIYTDAGIRTCQGFPGSFNVEERDAACFAEWGADYVKIDWCNTKGLDAKRQYAIWSRAFLKTGRPIVFSICEWGSSRPWEWAGTVGHAWRTTGDIEDRWERVLEILDANAGLYLYAGPGRWNDPDMLEVGNGGMSETEYRTHFSLWCMLAAPLMAGNDLRVMSEDTCKILTAREVIEINQDFLGRQGRRIKKDGDTEVWLKELVFGDRAVLLFNRSEEERDISIHFKEIGLWPGSGRVRDVWQRKDLGAFEESYRAQVSPHGCVLLRVSGIPLRLK